MNLVRNREIENELPFYLAAGGSFYEFFSSLYPIIRQAIKLKSLSVMMISLNPRYYNVEVIRKERELRLAANKSSANITNESADGLRRRGGTQNT